MTFHYHLSGDARKKLVYTMAGLLECKPRYLGIPSYAYEVGDYTVSRNGDVTFDDRMDSDEVEMLFEALMERGYKPEAVSKPEPRQHEQHGQLSGPKAANVALESDEPIMDLVVSLPIDGYDAGSLNRLHTLIASKRTLLQRALGVELLPVQVTEDRVSFPWFHGEIDSDHAQAYMNLIVQLCAMAKNSKRITAKDKETDNDKYAFRCFLLRLGFIGDSYKRDRKILLEKLEGSSAFRNGAPKPQTSPTLGAETEVSA